MRAAEPCAPQPASDEERLQNLSRHLGPRPTGTPTTYSMGCIASPTSATRGCFVASPTDAQVLVDNRPPVGLVQKQQEHCVPAGGPNSSLPPRCVQEPRCKGEKGKEQAMRR